MIDWIKRQLACLFMGHQYQNVWFDGLRVHWTCPRCGQERAE